MTSPNPTEPAAPPVEPPATPPAPPVPTPPPAPPAAPPAPAPGDGGDPDTFDRAYVEKLRKEAADRRTAAAAAEQAAQAAQAEAATHAAKLTEQQATLDAIMKSLGLGDAEPADPAKLQEQLTAAETQREADIAALTATHAAQIRQLTVQATLPGVLAKAGADTDLTTAVLTASGALTNLDPASPSFAADLESAVAAAVEANPKLKVAPVAVRSGAEIPGRSGGSDQVTREQLARMSTAEIEKARTDGRLKNLLGGG